MRLIPALTAMLVAAFLYLVVFEREALLLFAAGGEAPDQESQQADAPAVAAVGVVARHSVAQSIDSAVVLRGQTRANREVDVRSEISSRVISPPLRKGAYVNADDVLCQLDPGTREAALADASANLLESESRVPEAEARLEEAHALVKEAMINVNAAQKLSEGGYASETRVAQAVAAVRSSEATVQSAMSGLESAKAGIQSAQARIAEAEKAIERLTIKAPFEGLLESDTAELGSLMQPGSLCATVIQLDPIKVIGFVPETAVERVEVGALAIADLTSGVQLQGAVTFLSRSADPETRTFLVEIDVPNEDLSIRDGQTAEIVIGAEGQKAHLLPQSVLTLNDEGKMGVRVVDAGSTAQFQPVTLMRDTVDGIWVSGLPDEADVILVGQEFVIDGVPVAPTYEEVKP
ncbi:MAG: efflux RND transporter periplasmic adaptor subunit [Paracoccaceae bacterium]